MEGGRRLPRLNGRKTEGDVKREIKTGKCPVRTVSVIALNLERLWSGLTDGRPAVEAHPNRTLTVPCVALLTLFVRQKHFSHSSRILGAGGDKHADLLINHFDGHTDKVMCKKSFGKFPMNLEVPSNLKVPSNLEPSSHRTSIDFSHRDSSRLFTLCDFSATLQPIFCRF